MFFDIDGLILKENSVKDNDRFLDVLTESMGRISIYARGIRSYKSKNRDATMPLCFSTFSLEKQKDDFIVLKEAHLKEGFNDTRIGLLNNAFCMYVCEIARELSLPNVECRELYRVTLNSLHAICHNKYPIAVVKPAFELRAMCEEGYMPDIDECGFCSKKCSNYHLDVINGTLLCDDCYKKSVDDNGAEHFVSDTLMDVSPTVYSAIQYIVTSPIERLFAFGIDKDSLNELQNICETYLLNHMEKSFATLDFLHHVDKLGI